MGAMKETGVLSKGQNKIPVKKFCSGYPSDKKSKDLDFSISILESTLFNKQLSEGSSISVHYLGNDTREAPAKVEKFLSVSEYGDCERYDFTENDKSAGYQPDALRYSKPLLDLYKK